MRSGSAGIMLIEELVVDLDYSANSHGFDGFEDLGEGFDLGLGEEPGSLLDYLRTPTLEGGEESLLFDARAASSHGAHVARLSHLLAGPRARLLSIKVE